MLALFRGFLNTWAAKAFFGLLIASFALFGVGNLAHDNAGGAVVATVGDRRIELPQLQETVRRSLAEVARRQGTTAEPAPAVRMIVTEQAVQSLVTRASVALEADRLGITVPDSALRQVVLEAPEFRSADGAFDKARFDAYLRNSRQTEAQFFAPVREDLALSQLLEVVRSGAAAPGPLAAEVFRLQRETRVAEVAELSFAAASEPPAPSEAELRQAYEANPAPYTAPEYRRIKAVILSPERVADDVVVSDADLRAAYDARRGEYATPEKRTVEVLVAPDQASGATVAELWTGGVTWTAMEQAAERLGTTPVLFEAATRQEFPSPELAEAVFQAPPETVVGPLQSPLGWQVFRVRSVVPAVDRSFEDARDEIRTQLQRARAPDLVEARVNQLEDALAGAGSLDELPGDLGLAAVAGTLDAQGGTPAGEPAPIPGSPALREALIRTAFQTAAGTPARLIEGPDKSYYALTVEETVGSALKPFAEVEASVREAWEQAARRREQQALADRLLAAVRGGSSLDDAATVAGVRVTRTPALRRDTPTPGVAFELIAPLFKLREGEPALVETADGFLVAVPVAITSPDPDTDPAALAQLRTSLERDVGEDIARAYSAALRDRADPRINRQLVQSIAQP